MGSGIFFPLSALPIIIVIVIIFNIKKHVENSETKIYNYLIITNFIGLIIELLCALACRHYTEYPIISFFILKTYIVYLVGWTATFAIYVLRVTISNWKDLYRRIHWTLLLILFTIIYILPIDIVVKNNYEIFYTEGVGANFSYIVSGIYILAIFIVMLANIKKLKNKKYLPVFLFFIIGTIAIIIQKTYPQFLLLTYVQTFICLVMYFTIENPDLKMVKELEIAREQADKANRAKTDFLSSMSHEIRTPLNAIVNFSDEIVEAKDLGEAKTNAQDIVNASQTLLEIVNGILDISKIEAGKLEIVNSCYSPKDTFIELAKLITPKMAEKGLYFTYTIAQDLPNVLYGDHANIKKIVTNLLSNACKYTEKGFVRYEVNCVNTEKVSKLIISVEDSGRGIKKENIDKLFTKFQRLEEDRNTTIEGTGLGLAITKQLTELMGGRVFVNTVYGQGSKFTIIINQKIEKKDKLKDKKKVSTNLDLTDVKILLVDDNNLNLKVAVKLLERYKANQVVTCESGFECIEKIKRKERYDFILLDDMMPKMSGVETLSKLKEIEGFNIPVVVLTANAISGMREKYLQDGFDDYLAKPIEKDKLIMVVNSILGRSQTEEIEIQKEEEVEDKTIRLESITPVGVLGDDNTDPKEYLKSKNINIESSLELLGDIEMYNMTVEDFLKEVEEKWKRIKEEKESKDITNYTVDVHSLKSDSKYLGLTLLADISYEHELKGKENDIDYINNNFNKLEEAYISSLEILNDYKTKFLNK